MARVLQVSVIQYGGRITDDFDQLLMDTFAEKYFHPGVLQVGCGTTWSQGLGSKRVKEPKPTPLRGSSTQMETCESASLQTPWPPKQDASPPFCTLTCCRPLLNPLSQQP